MIEETRPAVVSFHFGLPPAELLSRVKAAGALILSSATTVAEARWLEQRGVDAIIAQGREAGGHRGMFLSDDIDAQPGLISLLPQVRDAVRLPVVAAGGISDGRGIAAAFALGADAVQIGTAYLRTPEATISPLHRAALASARDDATRLTNVFTGRPARGLVNRFVAEVGPMCSDAPHFPLAAGAAAPLRTAAEGRGSSDFSPLWAGEAAALARDEGAEALTRRLWAEAIGGDGRLDRARKELSRNPRGQRSQAPTEARRPGSGRCGHPALKQTASAKYRLCGVISLTADLSNITYKPKMEGRTARICVGLLKAIR